MFLGFMIVSRIQHHLEEESTAHIKSSGARVNQEERPSLIRIGAHSAASLLCAEPVEMFAYGCGRALHGFRQFSPRTCMTAAEHIL